MGLEKVKNRWFVKLRVATSALSYVYPYTLPEILLISNKKSEVEIKAQFIESFNTQNYLKEFEVNKTYRYTSLSGSEIKNRQRTIIKILKGLKTKKIINNKILIYFNNVSKDRNWLEVDDLTNNLLGKISKTCFLEKWG